jgi:hypothetical protein
MRGPPRPIDATSLARVSARIGRGNPEVPRILARWGLGRDGAGGCKARLTKCESGRIVKAERAGVTPRIARSISNVFTQTEDS